MEVCCNDQDDKNVASLHSDLSLLDNSIGYENADNIECKPYGHFEECVDRIHNSCQYIPDEGKAGMSTLNKDGTAGSIDDTVNERSGLSADHISARYLLNTKMNADELIDVCADPEAITSTTVGEMRSCSSSESTLGNAVEVSQRDLTSAINDVIAAHEVLNDEPIKDLHMFDLDVSKAGDIVDVLVEDSPSVESGNTNCEHSTLETLNFTDSTTENDGVTNDSIEVDTSDVVDPTSVKLMDLSGVDEQNLQQINDDDEGKKKGYRVRFHENHVVSGYLEPASPWRDVSLCSTAELVSSYRNACTLMAVKPSNKVLQQLEGISSFEERHELLSLRGENIDIKLCETLEEVFRRVRFRSIDIEATSLDEDTAVTIFDLLDYYEACQRLNISFNKNLGIRGWQACARFIRKTASLEVLEARGCSFNDPAMTIVGRSLRLGSVVKSLHLENCFLSGRPLMLLVAAVKFNEVLRELFLADNKLTPTDGIQLGSLLKTNRTLSLLDIRNNLIQDVGMHHICDGLSEQTTSSVGLNTLVVWNNQITYESMGNVARALTNVINLETINIGHNNITNEGIHRLKEGLLQNKSLLRIGLQSAKISCEGAVALAEFVAESYKLLRLDLRGNYIRTGGLMALTLSLKVNQSVTRLDLDQESKKEPGMRDYVEQQRRLLSDIALYTARNLSILAGTASSSNADSSLQSADVPLSSASRPTLTLPTGFVTPSESLESPAYVPVSNPITSPAAGLDIDGDPVSGILSPDWAEAPPSIYSTIDMASPSDERCPPLILTISETNDPVTSQKDNSESGEDILKPPSSLPAIASKTSQFAASVRRKFTVSKATLPSPTATNKGESTAPVVLFTKMALQTEDGGIDDTARVCFQAESSSTDIDADEVEPRVDVLNSAENQAEPDVENALVLQEMDVSNSTETIETISEGDCASTVSEPTDAILGLNCEMDSSRTITGGSFESFRTSQEAVQQVDILYKALQEFATANTTEDNELGQKNLGPYSNSRREPDRSCLIGSSLKTDAADTPQFEFYNIQMSDETNVTDDVIVLNAGIALDADNSAIPRLDINSPICRNDSLVAQEVVVVEQINPEDQCVRDPNNGGSCEIQPAHVNRRLSSDTQIAISGVVDDSKSANVSF